jgi:hypothetical protein
MPSLIASVLLVPPTFEPVAGELTREGGWHFILVMDLAYRAT